MIAERCNHVMNQVRLSLASCCSVYSMSVFNQKFSVDSLHYIFLVKYFFSSSFFKFSNISIAVVDNWMWSVCVAVLMCLFLTVVLQIVYLSCVHVSCVQSVLVCSCSINN